MNTTGWLGSISGILLLMGTAIAWVVKRWDNKKDPLPKTAAEVALAAQALGIIKEAAEFSQTTLTRRITELEAGRASDALRITDLERSRLDDRHVIEDLQRGMAEVRSLLSSAARYIEHLLTWANSLMGQPNPPPLPAELHDIIDPALWRNARG